MCVLCTNAEAVRREVKPRVIKDMCERRMQYRDVLGGLLLCL